MANPSVPLPAPNAVPESDEDLDDELQELFDAPDAPHAPQPQPISQQPTRPAEQAPKSVLHSLIANKHRLTGRAAQLAAELDAITPPVVNGFSNVPRLPISEAMIQRRASKRPKSCAQTAREEASRIKRARNAFKVIGKEAAKSDKPELFEFIDTSYTNMALKEAVFPPHVLQALFEHFVRVDIAEITRVDDDMRGGKLGEFVLFGCLVKKHAKKETKGGGKYAVWSMCNMPRGTLPGKETVVKPTMVTVLVFDEAFQSFHTQVEGSVFALRKPTLLPPRGSETGATDNRGGAEWSGHCLRVAKKDHIIRLGVCKDFKLCETGGPNLSTCGRWYDSNRMSQCSFHTNKRRHNMVVGTRMDLNNAERPRVMNSNLRVDESPADISFIPMGKTHAKNEADIEMAANKRAQMRRIQDRQKVGKLLANRTLENRKETLASALRPKVQSRKSFEDTPISELIPTRNKNRVSVPSGNLNRRRQLMEQRSRQERYENAVKVLVHYGFVLEVDGSLTAPTATALEDKGLALKTSNGIRRGRGVKRKACEEKDPKGMNQDVNCTKGRDENVNRLKNEHEKNCRGQGSSSLEEKDVDKGQHVAVTVKTGGEQSIDCAPGKSKVSSVADCHADSRQCSPPSTSTDVEGCKSDLLELSEESDSEDD